MTKCIFYQYKEGDYHCSLTNHDISDTNHVRKYCWGSCEDCPVYKGGQQADHHRGTDECIYYCMREGDYYCQKACQYISTDMVHSYCRNYSYRNCYIYTDSKVVDTDGKASATDPKSTDTSFQSVRKRSSDSVSDASKNASGSSESNDDYSAVSVIISIIGAVFVAAWKLIKTIPFWGPYGSILLMVFTMHAGPAGSSSGGGTAGVVGLFYLAYLILHTILLFKCKKWQAKYRYWPIYTEFIILIIGALLGGASYLVISSIAIVAFQIGMLVYMKRKTQNTQEGNNAEIPVSENSKEQKARKKTPLFVILPATVILLLSIFQVIQFSGYKPFVKEYFNAAETGDMNEITQFYSWDYVEEKNKNNKSNRFTELFTWDSLEYYIDSNDKYCRWFLGDEIEKIEISQTKKNMLSATPQIKVEVHVVFENRAKDVVVFLDMERGSDGWYMTGTDAYYAPDEAED